MHMVYPRYCYGDKHANSHCEDEKEISHLPRVPIHTERVSGKCDGGGGPGGVTDVDNDAPERYPGA